MNMWANEKVLRFIKDLQGNPCLWDAHCVDNKNRMKKYDTVEFLANKYGTNISEIEKKMLNLKSQFRRERRKIFETRKSGGSPKRPSWFAYEALLFLAKQKTPKESLGTVAEEKIEEDFPTIVEAPTTESEVMQLSFDGYSNCSFQNKILNADENGIMFHKEVSNKKTVQNDDIGIIEAFTCMKTLVSLASQRDRFSVYGEHIANKLRNSGKSREEIAVAQHHIDQICFNLDMNVYNRKNNFGSSKDAQHNSTGNPFNAVQSEYSCSSTSPANSEDIAKPTPLKKRVKRKATRNPNRPSSFDLSSQESPSQLKYDIGAQESPSKFKFDTECDIKSETEYTEDLWDDNVLRYPTEVEESAHGGTSSGHQIYLNEVQPKLEPEEEMNSL